MKPTTAAPKPLSRQRRWQLDRVARGLCSSCGQPRTTYADRCDECARKRGGGTWTPGGLGRPPLTAPKKP